MRIPRTIARSVMLLLGIAALAGCASLDDDLPAHKPPEGRSGLAMSPLPDHSAAMRCMDDLLLDYGTRELAVAADELADPARKTAGYRYLLLSAASDMSKRSRAIRVVAQGTEAGAPRSLRPQFVLRGSISRAQDRTMGLDLMAVTVQDGTVASGGVTNRKFRSDAADELVLRSLVEAASIEVFGRLAKVPYWTCLGQRSDDPAVSAEIGDWYDTMAARPKEIIEYFQAQLGLRGAYAGPVDGAVNPELNDAVARYREALGLSREPRLTKDFMQAFLAADHRAVKAKLAPAAKQAGDATARDPGRARSPCPDRRPHRPHRPTRHRWRCASVPPTERGRSRAANSSGSTSSPAATRMSTASCRTRAARSAASSRTASSATRASPPALASSCRARCASRSA